MDVAQQSAEYLKKWTYKEPVTVKTENPSDEGVSDK